ncbi:MAG: hypothetical protein ABI305_00320 [Tepidiformaceae bacterium]
MTATEESGKVPEQSRNSGIADKLRPDRLVRDTPLLDDLTDQLDRTRKLLTDGPEGAAAVALDRFVGQAEIEARIALELSVREPLALPDRFLEAHRITMRALEVLDREGTREPPVPNIGPLKPIAAAAIEFVAEYIVKSYTQTIISRLRKLYARREIQSEPTSPERRLLAGARVETDRIAGTYGGGGVGAPVIVAGGVALPVLASVTQYLGAINLTDRWVLLGSIAVLFVIFLAFSTVLLRGAAVARRRCRLTMQQPLAALWETIGHAGNPPVDDSVMIASGALVLAALVWFVLPVGAALVYVIF